MQRRKSGFTSLLFGESWPSSAVSSRPIESKLLEPGLEGGKDGGVHHPHTPGWTLSFLGVGKGTRREPWLS